MLSRSVDADGPWTRELVAKSLERLRDPIWKVQKAGVAILSALAQTGTHKNGSPKSFISRFAALAHGVATIDPHIPEIVGMLLPESYRPISTSASGPTFTSSDSSEGQTPPADLAVAQSPTLLNAPSRPPSWMMGPACALRILAQSGKCYLDLGRDVGTYVTYYFRYTARQHTQCPRIRHSKKLIFNRNAR